METVPNDTNSNKMKKVREPSTQFVGFLRSMAISRQLVNTAEYNIDSIKVEEEMRQPCLLNNEEQQFFDGEKVFG